MKKMLYRKDAYLYHASAKLLFHKPRLVSRLFKLYSSYIMTKQNRLRSLDIAITKKCQYSCPHCYPKKFYCDSKSPLSVSEIIECVKQGLEMGAVQFNFQGGEPTFDLDYLESIVSQCYPWVSYISLSSNGYRHKVDDLKRIYNMGVDKIALSLYSAMPQEHDTFVGSKGSFNQVMECMENMEKIGLEISLAITLTRDNIYSEGVQGVINLCVRKNIILDINVAMPLGKWSGQKHLILEEKDYRYLNFLNRRYPNIRRDIHPRIFRKGCPAAKEFLYVNLYGDVLPCPFLHFSLGNLRDSKLKDLYKKALNNKWFAHYYPQCLAVEAKDFFEHYVSKVFDTENLPLNWDEVFTSDELLTEEISSKY